jgi:putative PEP-CTERM system histidine kinase
MSPWEEILFWGTGSVAVLSGLLAATSGEGRIQRFIFLLICFVTGVCFGVFPIYDSYEGVPAFHDFLAPAAISLPFLWMAFSIVFARENANEYLRKSIWWLVGCGAVFLVFVGISFNSPLVRIKTSLGGELTIDLLAEGKWFAIVVLLVSAFTLINVESTFRASTGVYRRRLRPSFVVIALFFAAVIFSLSSAILKDELSIVHPELHALLALLLFPILAFYLRGYRSQQSGVYVRGQAVYSSIGIIVIGLYLVIVGGMGKALSMIGADIKVFYSIIAAFFIIVLFLAVLLSSSIKRRFRRYVDRSVSLGAPADYHEDLAGFAEDISHTLDISELIDTLSSLLKTRLSVDKLWLFLEHPHLPTYSLSYPTTDQNAVQIQKDSHFADWIFRHGEAIAIEDLTARLKSAEVKFPPSAFPVSRTDSVCLPLIAKRTMVGILFFSRESGSGSLGHKEIQFISAVGNQFALAVLSARLSEELLVARQIESFNKFSAFVMHDLKNSVSMLSMLMQNFARNVSKPEFQQSALATIQGAVSRMQTIMSKLSSSESLSRLNLTEVRLAEILNDLRRKLGLESLNGINYVENIGEAGAVRADREQLSSIIENLIVNAIEAMPTGGDLTVKSYSEDNHVVVEVSDTGVGMDQNFINKRLFRPFETTKRKGLGIGLYQSRDQLERMGGAFKVSSRLGEGTTFRIELPQIGMAI